jgi:hypothetical protein
MIRERARRSATLAALSDGAERAFWRLTVTVDDHGGFDSDPEVLLAELFTRRPRGWTVRRMAAVLDEWERAGLIHRYTAARDETDAGIQACGHVVTWKTYQRLRESRPRFPAPPCGGIPSLFAKCGESRQIAATRGSLPLTRAAACERAAEAEAEAAAEAVSEADLTHLLGAECRKEPTWPSPDALVRLYNAQTPDECPTVTTLSAARRKKARQALAAFPDEAWWREVFVRIHRSRFLRGLVKRPGHEGFVADLDWLLSKGKDGVENAVKTHDGRYQDG